MNRQTRPGSGQRRSAGFTLIELLVAVAIGMALVLAITLMMVRFESGRRTLTSHNDSSIGGAYVSYALDRVVRSAGSGYTQSWRNSFGCQLLASRSGTQVLPRSSAFPAPFASVPQNVLLAPLVIHAGIGTDGSDVLAVQTGSSGLGESPLSVLPASATATNLRVPATIGLRGADLVLVFQGSGTCMLQEVAAGFVGGATQQIDFGGAYADDDINSVRLQDMGALNSAWVTPLGNRISSPPQFQLLGVGDNATLVALDMLKLDGSDTVVAVADGVADLRARYGVDSDDDGRVDSWQDPAVAPWDAATLLDGSSTSQLNMSRVLAVRIGLMLRSSSPERDDVTGATLTLFDDLSVGLQASRTLTSAEQKLRWRTLDFTVPMRNLILKP